MLTVTAGTLLLDLKRQRALKTANQSHEDTSVRTASRLKGHRRNPRETVDSGLVQSDLQSSVSEAQV